MICWLWRVLCVCMCPSFVAVVIISSAIFISSFARENRLSPPVACTIYTYLTASYLECSSYAAPIPSPEKRSIEPGMRRVAFRNRYSTHRPRLVRVLRLVCASTCEDFMFGLQMRSRSCCLSVGRSAESLVSSADGNEGGAEALEAQSGQCRCTVDFAEDGSGDGHC